MSKKYDFYNSRKISFNDLAEELKTDVSILGGLDIFTDAHVRGVTDITYRICTEMHMPYEKLKYHVLGAYLHDVGKIYIPSEILQKNGPLTDEEYQIMKKHTEYGYDICMKYHQFKNLAAIARWHHESFDGSGYPDGLKGERIPMEVSLVKVADVYDALTRRRQYKEGFSQSKTLGIMIEDVKKNRMCAKFLYYLISYLLREIDEKIKGQFKNVVHIQGELKTLHELESIYKNIYDRGYNTRFEKKLKRYILPAGYDMSTNARLLTTTQKAYEKASEVYDFLISERKIMQNQLKEVAELVKREKWYK